MSIARKTVKGAFWLSFSKVIQQAAGILTIIILSRLLYPSDFGLIAMVGVFVAFVQIFTSVGFGAAVINRRNATQQQMSTLYWLTHVLGIFTCLVIILSAPLAAEFFDEPRLQQLVRFLALNAVITPFYIFHRRLMERDLEFASLARIDILAAIGSSAVGIILALLGFSVYALICQSLMLNFLFMFFLRLKNPWRAEYAFSLHSVTSMIGYSLKYKMVSLTNYFERNIDYIILGRIFDAIVLGYYALAYNVMYFPVKRISYTFTETLFPAFSAIKDDPEKVNVGFIKSIQLVALVTFPLMTYVGLHADELVVHFFGKKWLPVVALLKILAAAGALQSIDQLTGALFAAVKRINVLLGLGIFKLVLTGICVLIGANYGVYGVAWGILVAKSIQTFLSFLLVKKYYDLALTTVLKALRGPVVGCVWVTVAYILNTRMLLMDSILGFLLSSAILCLVYSTSVYFTNAKDIFFIYGLLRSGKRGPKIAHV